MFVLLLSLHLKLQLLLFMQMFTCYTDSVETRCVTPLLLAPSAGSRVCHVHPPLSAKINRVWWRTGACRRGGNGGSGGERVLVEASGWKARGLGKVARRERTRGRYKVGKAESGKAGDGRRVPVWVFLFFFP